MPDRITAKLVGGDKLKRELARIDPSKNRNIVNGALIESMLLVLRFSVRNHIHAGGTGPPKPDVLTSRTGTLRRSISSDRSLDKTGLRGGRDNQFIEGGSSLRYAAIHEFGGPIRGGRMPKRPYLTPGLSDAEPKFPAIFVKHWRREIAK